MRLKHTLENLVLALGASASLYACGPGPTDNPDSGNITCKDSKSDYACNKPDAGNPDAGNPDDGGHQTNNAPVVDGITISNPVNDRVYSNSSPTEIRAGQLLKYNVDAVDPDGDAVQCQYTFKDASGNLVWESEDFMNCSIQYGLNGKVGETCSLETVARDSKGVKSNLAKVDLTLVDNLAPVLNYKVTQDGTQINSIGKNDQNIDIYEIELNKRICIDATTSYDFDGSIGKYILRPINNNIAVSSTTNPIVCTKYTSISNGSVIGKFSLEDNEGKATDYYYMAKVKN